MAKKIRRRKRRNPPALPVREIGRALQIDYERDGHEYTHRFADGVILYAHEDDEALIVQGGRMHVDAQGFIHE